MTVGFNTFFKKKFNVSFIVNNISSKAIRIFNLRIDPNRQADLMSIPEVSEADIKASILKGTLKAKLDAQEIEIISSNIDLNSYDQGIIDYLTGLGITIGVEGGSSAPVNILSFKPGGMASPGVALTWEEVNAFATAVTVPWTLFIDGSILTPEVPATADTDFRGLADIQILDGGDPRLIIKDGGLIRNVASILRGAIEVEAITTTGIIFDKADSVLIIDRGGRITNTAASLVPAVEVQLTGFVLVSLLSGGLVQNASVPIVEFTLDGFFVIPQVLNTNGGSPTWPDDSFIMTAGSGAINVHDGTATLGSHSGIAGFIIDIPVENSNYIGWQSGDTASRPTAYAVGQPYFDGDLGHPIWWNGSDWVDATGGVV